MARLRLKSVGLLLLAIVINLVSVRASGAFYLVLQVVLWIAAVGYMIASVLRKRRAARLASDHLSPTLGFRLRPAAFHTRAGWDAYIAREVEIHASGGKRPFFSISRP